MGPRRQARGFTLMELMMVMAILSVLFGLGLGALSRINPGERTLLSQVRSSLIAARSHARSLGTSCWVEFVRGRGEEDIFLFLRRARMVPLLFFGFQDGGRGAYGLKGELLGGETRPGGRFGMGFAHLEPGANGLEVDTTGRQNLRVDQGFLLDLRFLFRATEGEIRFGQAKDGGLGLRVADSMDVEDGGVIVNSHGDRNEAGTFDRPADWIDFSGLVAGRVGGLALFNGPDVPPHPWFTRDYGPALSNFMRFEPYTVAAGEQLQLSFRVYLHDGDAAAAEVAQHYLAYSRPPERLPG